MASIDLYFKRNKKTFPLCSIRLQKSFRIINTLRDFKIIIILSIVVYCIKPVFHSRISPLKILICCSFAPSVKSQREIENFRPLERQTNFFSGEWLLKFKNWVENRINCKKKTRKMFFLFLIHCYNAFRYRIDVYSLQSKMFSATSRIVLADSNISPLVNLQFTAIRILKQWQILAVRCWVL
jgi:hypothetical protein